MSEGAEILLGKLDQQDTRVRLQKIASPVDQRLFRAFNIYLDEIGCGDIGAMQEVRKARGLDSERLDIRVGALDKMCE